MSIPSTAQQIAFPMARNGAVFNLSRAIPDGDGINNLTSGLIACAGCFTTPHDPAAAQMGQKFLLENATRLNEQAFVDRLM